MDLQFGRGAAAGETEQKSLCLLGHRGCRVRGYRQLFTPGPWALTADNFCWPEVFLYP